MRRQLAVIACAAALALAVGFATGVPQHLARVAFHPKTCLLVASGYPGMPIGTPTSFEVPYEGSYCDHD